MRLMSLLGETGCRLAEIVGLELDDKVTAEEVIYIRPNSIRRLKTANSSRTLPLVGCAREAMLLALQHVDDHCLYPRYKKDGTCRATHASNALVNGYLEWLHTACETRLAIVSEPLHAHWNL